MSVKTPDLSRTTEDVRESALYATDCCNVEVGFKKGATFTRCPECERLTQWQLVRLGISPAKAA